MAKKKAINFTKKWFYQIFRGERKNITRNGIMQTKLMTVRLPNAMYATNQISITSYLFYAEYIKLVFIKLIWVI